MRKIYCPLVYWFLTGIWAFFALTADAQDAGVILNKGIPGNSSADLLQRADHDVIACEPDLVVILVGTNDLLNTSKMVSVAEYYANLDRLTDQLMQHNIRLALVSPPPVDTLYLYKRHDASRYPAPPIQLLAAARDSVEILCRKKNLLFIDLFAHLQKTGIPRHEEDLIIRNLKNSGSNDGVHFTVEGNHLLGQLIYGQLRAAFGELDHLKILCFGDSITYGIYMKGQGTADGDTYPAVLKCLIRKEIE